MINRKVEPVFKEIENIEVIKASEKKLSNGIPVYSVNAGSQELVKIEFIFKAGMYYQDKPLLASAANNLTETGTRSYSAKQISDKIDFYGAFLELNTGQDFSSITLYTLNKYLNETLSVIQEIICYPVFPKDEFLIYIKNKKQKYLINSQKVSVIARRYFTEMLFGTTHPYGREVKENDFENINVSDVVNFYNRFYSSQNCTVIVSGKINSDFYEKLDVCIGKNSWGSNLSINDIKFDIQSSSEKNKLLRKDDAIQSAIRIGRILFNKKHPDYFSFQVLNTILGGYFGSRLMANIREDKGYTYGIGSGLTSLQHAGYFYISTEVGADVTQKALNEIYHELKLLREEKIEEDELGTVKNYILGQMLRSIEGPFALAEKFKGIWMFGLGYDYYDNYFNTVKQVTTQQLQKLAQEYLQEEDLLECVAGKR